MAKSACALSTLAAPAILPAKVLGADAPSNRINVGFIGTGRQCFSANLPQMMAVPGVQVVCVCDTDRWRLGKLQEFVNNFYATRDRRSSYNGCKIRSDFREVIEDKDIDAPDDFHTRPLAYNQGNNGRESEEHFVLEKPVSISVQQGRQLADMIKQSGVTARTDSEFRSVRAQNHAAELVRNGHLGKLERIEITFPADPAPVGVQPDMPVPPELDYDMWLGPAPKVPYTEKRVHDIK